MFREKEIIGMLSDLNRKLNCIMSKPEGDVVKRLEDIENYCQEIQQKLEEIEENSLRDDEEFRFQIKQALREIREEDNEYMMRVKEAYDEAKVPKKRERKKKIVSPPAVRCRKNSKRG